MHLSDNMHFADNRRRTSIFTRWKSLAYILKITCLHSVIFIEWTYCDRLDPKIPGYLHIYLPFCLSICMSFCLYVSVYVCLFALERRNYLADFYYTFHKWSPIIYVWLCAFEFHCNNIIDDLTAAIFKEKNETVVTATITMCFSWISVFEYFSLLFLIIMP